MIQTVVGKVGSGKTRRLIDLANEAIKVETGNIVFIDDNTRYMYDLRHEIRFVNSSDYQIQGADMLHGLLCGMLAVNYDTTRIFIDPFIHIVGGDFDQLDGIFERLERLSEDGKCDFVIAISGDEEAMPECVTRRAI